MSVSLRETHSHRERDQRSKATLQKKQLIVLEGPIDIRGNKFFYSSKIEDDIIVIDIIKTI